MQKPKVVILGAGPAGMSAAWRLTKLGYPVTVLERDGAVGGMGRTIKVGDYSVDFGPHTFHIRETPESKEILKTITPFFGDSPLTLVRISVSRIVIVAPRWPRTEGKPARGQATSGRCRR